MTATNPGLHTRSSPGGMIGESSFLKDLLSESPCTTLNAAHKAFWGMVVKVKSFQ